MSTQFPTPPFQGDVSVNLNQTQPVERSYKKGGLMIRKAALKRKKSKSKREKQSNKTTETRISKEQMKVNESQALNDLS